ncbi:Sporulation minus regulator 2 [Trametes pubescens]|uniref:Sporulation minus regulator 2 n=1 Tax=Trametes pubescens TaxID=154538 RepID=A0A1M2W377_TRAPU|nr:Sporulation minus regulator 2 [Trametes pubescens]
MSLPTTEPHIRRPLNAFMLYRRDFNDRLKETGDRPFQQNLLSKTVGEQWNKEPDDVKEHYKELAMAEQEKHRRKYPGYKFKPVQKKDKKNKAAVRSPRKERKPTQYVAPPPPTPPSPERRSPADVASSSRSPPSLSFLRGVPYKHPELGKGYSDWVLSSDVEEQLPTSEMPMDEFAHPGSPPWDHMNDY